MSSATPPRKAAKPPMLPVQVLSVPAESPIAIRFLGAIYGLNTHWHSGKSVPCPGAQECPLPVHRSRMLFKAYGPVERWEATHGVWRPAVLEITENLEERLRGRDLRGEVWVLSREDAKAKASPVIGAFCEALPHAEVSAAFDIVPILCRFYHVQTLALGAANPIPPKVFLEAVEGPPPNLPPELQPAKAREASPEETERIRKQLQEAMSSMGKGRGAHVSDDPERNGKAAGPGSRCKQ